MLQKNSELTLLIEDTGINGEGIAKHENMAVFVRYALTGEKVRAKIILVKKKFAVAKLLEVLTPAEERTRPVCPVFNRCGGCALQHIKYYPQLGIKTENVKNCLGKIAKLYPEVKRCKKSDLSYGYRNKLQLPVGDNCGTPETGFFAEFSHTIVPIEKCPLHPEWSDKLISVVKDFMSVCNIKGYNHRDGSGVIRHIVARELSQQIMITLVINADTLNCDYIIDSLKKYFPNFSLYININKESTNVVTGDKYILMYGNEKMKSESNGIKYKIGPASFMQINDYIRDKLYNTITEFVGNETEAVCIDAYSGAGLLSAHMAKRAKKVYSIEIVPQAVKDADEIRKANKLQDKMVNICGDCEIELPKILKEQKEENTVLILDPPRKGCSKGVIRTILENKPQKIIYISCNAATLARDLGLIMGTLDINSENLIPDASKLNNLYEITFVQPFDMFPQTPHVETLVCLARKE